jgi:hypothetical protein
MADSVDLTGDIAAAVNGAAASGHPIVISYVDDDGYPATSFRGSAQVYSPRQLAVWARKPDEGLARAIADRPKVSLVYFNRDSPGPRYLAFRGLARVDPNAKNTVYANMIESEQRVDPDRHGVAVVIDVEVVQGAGSTGRIEQRHTQKSSG